MPTASLRHSQCIRGASRLARRGLVTLLALTLLSCGFVAPAAQESRGDAAGRLYAEAFRLMREGTRDSLEQARGKFLEAAPLFRASGDTVREATALLAVGRIHSRLGEQQKALDYCNQALPLYRAAGDRDGEAGTLNNLGLIYDALGEPRKATDHYTQALLLFRAAGDRAGEAAALANIGFVHYTLGEQQKALDNYLRALPLNRSAARPRGEATILNNIGLVYEALGEPRKALDYFAQALPLYRAAGDRDGEAGTLSNIGASYDTLGEVQKALDNYNSALPLRRAVGDRAGEAATLNNIGFVYDTLGERRKALDYYERALSLKLAVGDRRGAAATLVNIGAAYHRLGETRKALDGLRLALPLLRAVGDRRNEAAALSNVAVVERDRGNLAGALENIEAALLIVESLRGGIGGRDLRTSFFASVRSYYEFYIDLLMLMHARRPGAGYDGRALEASERGRARTLLETLAEAGADIRQGADAALIERERDLRLRLNARAQRQERLTGGPEAGGQAAALAGEIDALTAELQQVEAQIRQTSPRYAALTQPQPLSLRDIQAQALDADTLLLEYSLGDERSYLWAVTPTSIDSYVLPKRSEVEPAAREFYAAVSAAPEAGALGAAGGGRLGEGVRRRAAARSSEAAARLSRMLLAPAAALQGKKRLLVVADGALQYIPFAALPLPADGAGAAPLVASHEVVSLPSASTIALLRRETAGRRAAARQIAVLADPVFELGDERLKTSEGGTRAAGPSASAHAEELRGLSIAKAAQDTGAAWTGSRIPRLPFTRREADEIIKLVPPASRRRALDFAASRAAATDPGLADYRYVHFATHGFLNSRHPELSGLLLSMFDERGRPQDGFLRAHEVFNLKLSADVVVLSACQTGLGKEVRGEGLVGLTRGFMYAGAPRVVVSLWGVNDEATAELMTRFYRGMLAGRLRPAEALRAAQVSMLGDERFGAPFYWAAFTLQGEWR